MRDPLKFLFSILLFVIGLTSDGLGQSTQDKETGGLAELIVFSGSDWCLNCMKLDKTIIQTPVFQAYAKGHIKLTLADFPQKSKLSADLVKANESLAAKYNPEGSFPKIVLILPHTASQIDIPYANQSPEDFVKTLEFYVRQSAQHE